ncbi:hypothetical protein LWC05_12020 [Acetobacter sicerae]|uniref:Uncharacterized protein n=1 Tax=Acetobacter sicerae TaxID=85325 RepID=A0ABS8VY07_9PROT|nr:hypothetical protein [Acetobacter sicerae]MCE0744609.1 hypothetical protein [Acetobacter sicerae]
MARGAKTMSKPEEIAVDLSVPGGEALGVVDEDVNPTIARMKEIVGSIDLSEEQAAQLRGLFEQALGSSHTRDDAAIAFSGGAEIVGKGAPDGGSIAVASGHIVVVCRRPGMRRAGIRHSALEVYPLDYLTEAQQRSIGADPDFELIRVF